MLSFIRAAVVMVSFPSNKAVTRTNRILTKYNKRESGWK